MVRSGEDIEKAVSTATELFWSKGFIDTSMQEVVEATGFNRYALYTSFCSKRDQLLSRDAAATAVNVVLQYPEASMTEVPTAAATARALRDSTEAKFPNLDISLTGISSGTVGGNVPSTLNQSVLGLTVGLSKNTTYLVG